MRGNLQVPMRWILAMLAVTVLAVSTITTVTPLGEKMNALAITIAGDVVCSQCVGINSNGSNDIKDGSVTGAKIASSAVTTSKLNGGSVTNAKLGDGAVTTSKIADGTIKSADVSTSFVEIVHLVDSNSGVGWDPNNLNKHFIINDPKVTGSSVIALNLGQNVACRAAPHSGTFDLYCDSPPSDGFFLNYAVFNK